MFGAHASRADPRMIRDAARGALAGGLATAALNLVTYADVTLRGRPMSDVPADTVGELADRAHLRLAASGDEQTAANRRSGLGALMGYATGAAVGALYGALRPFLPRRAVPAAAVAVSGAAMVAGNGSAALLGTTDPRRWGLSGWLADIVPHAAFGATAVALTERLRR